MPGGGGQVVVYTILSLILFFIVFYIIWKATKTKRMKKRMEKIEQKKAKETLELYFEFILTYNLIIDFTNNELENFLNKNSERKMSEIKVGAKKLLLKLISREDFAIFFQNDSKYELFVHNAELLTATQANLWDKKIPNVLNFFKEQKKLVPNDEKINKLVEITNKTIMRQFYEERKKDA